MPVNLPAPKVPQLSPIPMRQSSFSAESPIPTQRPGVYQGTDNPAAAVTSQLVNKAENIEANLDQYQLAKIYREFLKGGIENAEIFVKAIEEEDPEGLGKFARSYYDTRVKPVVLDPRLDQPTQEKALDGFYRTMSEQKNEIERNKLLSERNTAIDSGKKSERDFLKEKTVLILWMLKSGSKTLRTPR